MVSNRNLSSYLETIDGSQKMITSVNAKKEGLKAFSASHRALSNLNWKPKSKSVFIKPNIGATSKTANTDPEIVKGIIHYLKEIGIEDIIVGEGSVETEYESTSYNFDYCGWDRLAEDEGIKLMDLNRAERTEIPWHYGKIAIPRALFGKTYINVAKMKTHMQTLVSLCIKNQKGLLDSDTRKTFHRLGLHKPIACLAEVIKPELCMVDGIVAIEGNGPANMGNTREMGMIVLGSDMIEVDRACCRTMGINPDRVEHIRLISEGVKDTYEPSDISGRPFKLPEMEFKMFRVHMRPENACTACMSSVGKLNKLARRSIKGIWHFLNYVYLRRLDIIIGNPEKLPENHGKCIFYGNCASQIAKNYPEYLWIEGCPPNSKKALETVTR